MLLLRAFQSTRGTTIKSSHLKRDFPSKETPQPLCTASKVFHSVNMPLTRCNYDLLQAKCLLGLDGMLADLCKMSHACAFLGNQHAHCDKLVPQFDCQRADGEPDSVACSLSYVRNAYPAVLGFLPHHRVISQFRAILPNALCWSIEAALSCSNGQFDDDHGDGVSIEPLTEARIDKVEFSLNWQWNKELHDLQDQWTCSETQEPRERAPCIVGWGEVESPKVVCDKASRKIYYCTYCNRRLSSRRSFVISWKNVIFCDSCKRIPQCRACNKKAVPFVYTGADGIPCASIPEDFEGLNLCGQCMLINPVDSDEKAIQGIEERAREFLGAFFGVVFNEELLSAQNEPEIHNLRSLWGCKDTGVVEGFPEEQQPPKGSMKPKSTSRLPFAVEPTGCHLMGSSLNTYGQCQTMTVGIQSSHSVKQCSVEGERKCRVVLRIMVARGLPEGLFLAHLVHELLHAFIYLSTDAGCNRIGKASEEGMCNIVMAACLQARCEVLQRSRSEIIRRIEGIGLKASTKDRLEKLESLPKVKHLLESVRKLNEREHERAQAWIIAESMLIPIPGCLPSLYHQLGLIEYELRVLNKKLNAMEDDKHEEYGEGYRRMRSLADQLPLSKILRDLRTGEGNICSNDSS